MQEIPSSAVTYLSASDNHMTILRRYGPPLQWKVVTLDVGIGDMTFLSRATSIMEMKCHSIIGTMKKYGKLSPEERRTARIAIPIKLRFVFCKFWSRCFVNIVVSTIDLL